MELGPLTKLFADSPLPAACALLVLAVVGLYLALLRAHRREMALAMRVVVLAERLVPLVEKAKRRTGVTGSHPVVGGGHAEE